MRHAIATSISSRTVRVHQATVLHVSSVYFRQTDLFLYIGVILPSELPCSDGRRRFASRHSSVSRWHVRQLMFHLAGTDGPLIRQVDLGADLAVLRFGLHVVDARYGTCACTPPSSFSLFVCRSDRAWVQNCQVPWIDWSTNLLEQYHCESFALLHHGGILILTVVAIVAVALWVSMSGTYACTSPSSQVHFRG
jgi:hypothetical protein